MPPRSTSTWSSWTSLAALAAAFASSVALSSRISSTRRPRMPPAALMSSTTILATLAPAMPMKDSAPVWSAITPTLMSSMALGLVAAGELEHLRPALVPGLRHDRRDLGVGDEALPAVRIPVEDHPDPVILVGIAEDERPLGPVLLPLLGTLGREDVLELLEVLERRRCQDHDRPP